MAECKTDVYLGAKAYDETRYSDIRVYVAENGFSLMFQGKPYVFANGASLAKWMEDWALGQTKARAAKKGCACGK